MFRFIVQFLMKNKVNFIALFCACVCLIQGSRIKSMRLELESVKHENQNIKAQNSLHVETKNVISETIKNTQLAINKQAQVDMGDDSDSALYGWLLERSKGSGKLKSSERNIKDSQHGASRVSKARQKHSERDQKKVQEKKSVRSN